MALSGTFLRLWNWLSLTLHTQHIILAEHLSHYEPRRVSTSTCSLSASTKNFILKAATFYTAKRCYRLCSSCSSSRTSTVFWFPHSCPFGLVPLSTNFYVLKVERLSCLARQCLDPANKRSISHSCLGL